MVKSKFTPAEKSRVVLESLNTNISTAELCRKYNIHPQTFYSWKERFVEGGKASLDGTPIMFNLTLASREGLILLRFY